MTRFLPTAAASLATTSMGGCFLFAEPNRLRVYSLSNGIPSKSAGAFEKEQGKSTEYKGFKTYKEIWEAIQEGKDLPDLVGINDRWLDQAIAKNLIQSVPLLQIAKQIPQWAQLTRQWQSAGIRKDQVWGIPYRWGATAIAYNTDKVKNPISKWSDLWRAELKGKITLPDSAREVIGLSLKQLGYSYQHQDLASIKELPSTLKALHAQVLAYTSDYYLQTLVTDDSWVAVGWTSDLIKAQQLYPNLAVVIPTEGTAMWADLWTVAKGTKNLSAAQAWINFYLQPAIAAKITALTDIPATISALDLLPENLKQNPLKFPSPQVLAKSELLLPLPDSTANQYLQTWQKLRQV